MVRIHQLEKPQKLSHLQAVHEESEKEIKTPEILIDTVCPRSLYPIYIVSYYMKWVKTSWTYSY